MSFLFDACASELVWNGEMHKNVCLLYEKMW